jgi:hypothetical protein
LSVDHATHFSLQHGWLCADWMVRVRVPAWLDLAGQGRRARAIRRLTALGDVGTAEAAAPVLAEARDVAGATTRREAAWDAMWQARLSAANRAATAAAAEVAAAPIWLRIREAANRVAWDAARDAIGDTVWDCTWSVAWDAAWEAGDRDGRKAAVAALAPTAHALERDAVDILDGAVESRGTLSAG